MVDGMWQVADDSFPSYHLLPTTCYLFLSSQQFHLSTEIRERVGHKPGSVLYCKDVACYIFTIMRAVIYLGRLLPDASSGSKAAELVKDQP